MKKTTIKVRLVNLWTGMNKTKRVRKGTTYRMLLQQKP